MALQREPGSADIPWRTLVKMGWSTERIDKVKKSINTPSDRRKGVDRKRIEEAQDVGGNRRRHMQNLSIAGVGTRVRTLNGLKTIR